MNFFVSVAAGLITGLLLAPKTGQESRRIFKERFSSVRDRAMRRINTNGGSSEGESLESTGRADYLH
jgi:gas vesicle protein